MYLEESSGDNESQCSESYTTKERNIVLVFMGCMGVISFSMCLLAVVLVFCLKFHKMFTYRLALYQVLSAMMFSCTMIMVLGLINYDSHSLPYIITCKARAFLVEYFFIVNLLFTICLAFHLFYLAVFLKNLERLEVPYILVSTTVPLLFVWVPFINDSYGLVDAWCWIKYRKGKCDSEPYLEGIIEQIALWFVPLFVCLTVCLVAAVVIVAVLVKRVCVTYSEKTVLIENHLKLKNKKTLKELLPLLAYSVVFYCISFVPFAIRINAYHKDSPPDNIRVLILHALATSSFGLFSSLILVTHIAVVQLLNPLRKFIPLKHMNSVTATCVSRSSSFMLLSQNEAVMET